ncbi:MAG: hypothetical protein WBG92_24370 [Thiohalocapsa sp.]
MLWVLVAILAFGAISIAVYKAWLLFYPRTAERATLNPACDLRLSPCTVRFKSGASVQLDIQPRGIPVMRPLEATVQIDGLPAPRRVELDFAGFDMGMGYNRVILHPGDQPGAYAGGGMLPICVRNRMTWQARVLLDLPHGILAAPFRFDTFRAGGPADG